MNTNQTIIALLAVAIVGGGVYWYTGKDVMAPTEEWTLSASMSCADGTYFIAEFAADDKLNIVVDGVTARTLAKTGEAPTTYADADYTYVFAGEEVSVTTKATGAMTTCSQPMDPNNAPVNFGDAGEGGGEQPDPVLVVSESIVGKWQSNEDSKSVREFKADGSIDDIYDGEVVSSGMWVAFTKVTAPEVPFPLESDVVYIQMTVTGTQADTLNFKLTKLTPESLELIYLDRGGVLTYTAI